MLKNKSVLGAYAIIIITLVVALGGFVIDKDDIFLASSQDHLISSFNETGNIKLAIAGLIKLLIGGREGDFDAISIGSAQSSCLDQGNAVVKEGGDTIRKDFSLCQVKAGKSFTPSNYVIAPGGNGPYDWRGPAYAVAIRGYRSAETCFFMRAEGGAAVADIDIFGDDNATIKDAQIPDGEYQSYCYSASIYTGKNHPAAVHVKSGTVRIMSTTISGLQEDLPPYDDPDTKVGTIYYVDKNHPNASNKNDGKSEDTPWRTVVHAAKQVRAGETVYVKKGNYAHGEVEITHSGEPGKPIVLSAFPGHEREAVIKGDPISATGQSYIEIRNMKVEESSSYGIRVEGPEDPYAPPATNIVIAGNHTYDTCSSGISVWGVDWGEDPGDYDNIRNVLIEDNLVQLGTNGCRNEVITVANGASNVEVRYNTISIGDPNRIDGDEGVDFKEGVRDSSIHHNEFYDLADKAIYIDGGSADWSGASSKHDPIVENIQIYNNHIYDIPSQGISITTEGKGDVNNIFVFNNVVHDVDGNAVLVWLHPGGESEGGTVKNVHVINNTAYKTGRLHGGVGGYKLSDTLDGSPGMIFRNNIAWDTGGYGFKIEYSGATVDHNLCEEKDICEFNENPKFNDPTSRNLKLRSSSPVVNQGGSNKAPDFDFNDIARPKGGKYDLGAYER